MIPVPILIQLLIARLLPHRKLVSARAVHGPARSMVRTRRTAQEKFQAMSVQMTKKLEKR
jgi:hypothetical protein